MAKTEYVYTSRFLRTPFDLKLFSTSQPSPMARIFLARVISKNEKSLEKALTKIDLLGVTRYLEIDVSEINSTKEIYIRITKEHTVNLLKKNIVQPYNIAPPCIASYNILSGKVILEEGLTNDIVFSFYKTKYNDTQAKKAFSKYQSKGISIKDFPDYLNFIYQEYQKKVNVLASEINYSPELFVKMLAMKHIQKKIGFNLPRASLVQYSLSKNNSPKQVTLLNGDVEDWLPYLNENIRLENLAYIFLQTVYNEEGFDRYDRINVIAEAFQLKKEYKYKPEQIIEGGMLPLMWFKELYVNTNIDEIMLPHL